MDGSDTRIARPGTSWPTEPSRCEATTGGSPAPASRLGRLKLVTGLVSVSPYPSSTFLPKRCSKVLARATGSFSAPVTMSSTRANCSRLALRRNPRRKVGVVTMSVTPCWWTRPASFSTSSGLGNVTRSSPSITGYHNVTVHPKLWNNGRQPSSDDRGARLRRAANWAVLASTLRWVRGTPFGSSALPLVKSRTASSSSSADRGRPSRPAMTAAGRTLPSTNHLAIEALSPGNSRSRKTSWRLGGHGKRCMRRTNASTVMNLSRSACRMVECTTSWAAV